MSRKGIEWIIGLGIAGVSLILILLMIGLLARREGYGISIASGSDKVAVVELSGTFYDSQRFIQQIKRYGKQKSIKAIILRINSPGGGVAAAQELYESVKRVRDKGKPVIASMASVAASGGYYVACGADTIMANPGTVTGSIGVIAEFTNVRELLSKLGIRVVTIKSGKFKDTGSPFRDLNYDEKKYLQAFVDDAYAQFVEIVVNERQLPKEEILALADGRVYTGKQAVENGLIDLLGDYEDAKRLAAELAGIDGEPTIVKEQKRRRRGSIFDLFVGQVEGLLRGLHGMQVMYRMES